MALLTCLALAACGGDRKEPVVIAEVGGEDGGPKASSEQLDALAKKDAQLASKILTEALESEDLDLAAWSAVYLRRLQIEHDAEAGARKIATGAMSEDPLLATLCWRWLATIEGEELPTWKGDLPSEPVLVAMAAAAHLVRGEEIPKAMGKALALPAKMPVKKSKVPRKKILAVEGAAAPYDDGPLALAIDMVMAQGNGWTMDESWAARDFRQRLLVALGARRDDIEGALAGKVLDSRPPMTRLTDRLDLAITSQPPLMIRSVATNGSGGLRIDALRALAVVARRPEAGDLGAAAAAMRSEDPRERIEAARTFLLLAARSAR